MAADSLDGVVAERLLLPVGHYLGAELREDDMRHQVRVGPEVHDLDTTGFQVWMLAHGSPEALRNQMPWRRDSVLELSRHTGASSSGEALEQLLDSGLLAEVEPGSEGAVEFARGHRVIPLMMGLGNSAEEPYRFGIGMLGAPVLQVDFPTYDLWQWSSMDETLWATCDNAADVARRAGSADPGYLDADKLLTGFLRSLHALLMVRAACIDVPFRLKHPETR